MRKLAVPLFLMLGLVLAACGEAAGEGLEAGLQGGPPSPPAQEQQASPQPQPAAESGQQPKQEPQSQPRQQGDKQAAKAELPAGVTQAKVLRVIDGDTIEFVYIAGAQLPATRVRLIGVDTPESTTQVQPYGKEAPAYTKRQLEGKTVRLEKDVSETNRYGGGGSPVTSWMGRDAMDRSGRVTSAPC